MSEALRKVPGTRLHPLNDGMSRFIADTPRCLRKGYQKFKRAFIRKAANNEKIQTILQGKIETENIANEGDMVVRADTTSKEEQMGKTLG